MATIIGVIALVAFLATCAYRRAARAAAGADTTEQAAIDTGFADYSSFDQDQILRNRSERWDVDDSTPF